MWKWKSRKIEKVRKFKCLGYMLMANEGQKEHVKERSGSHERGMGNREKEIRKGLSKKTMIV